MKPLSFEQMESINGGNWIGDFCDWVGNALQSAWDWVSTQVGNLTFSFYTETIGGITFYGVSVGYR